MRDQQFFEILLTELFPDFLVLNDHNIIIVCFLIQLRYTDSEIESKPTVLGIELARSHIRILMVVGRLFMGRA